MEGRIAGLPAIPVLVPALPSPSSSTPASSTSPLRSRAHAPRRRIFTEQDLQPWFRSEALEHVQTTILRLTQAVQGRTNDEACVESEVRARRWSLSGSQVLTERSRRQRSFS